MRTTNTTNMRIDNLPDGILTNVATNQCMSATKSTLNDSEQQRLQVLDTKLRKVWLHD